MVKHNLTSLYRLFKHNVAWDKNSSFSKIYNKVKLYLSTNMYVDTIIQFNSMGFY
jgi:hypothetical protein